VFYADANPCKATVDLTDENQNIRLPVDPVPQGQPVYYPNNAFCQWRLTVPFDHVRIITLPRRWQLAVAWVLVNKLVNKGGEVL